jgi:hypothetical protein
MNNTQGSDNVSSMPVFVVKGRRVRLVAAVSRLRAGRWTNLSILGRGKSALLEYAQTGCVTRAVESESEWKEF